MPSYSYTITVNDDSAVLASTACSELFQHETVLQNGAADEILKLGLITDPIMIAVFSPDGVVTFKLDSTGTDSIGGSPVAIIANSDGLGVDEILLSNSSGVELDIVVIAIE